MTDRELAAVAYDSCLRGDGDPPFDKIEVSYAENLVYAAQKVRETGVVVSAFDQHVADRLALNELEESVQKLETAVVILGDSTQELEAGMTALENAVESLPKPKKRTKAKPVPIYKSAKTGKIVTEAYALRNPDTTFAT